MRIAFPLLHHHKLVLKASHAERGGVLNGVEAVLGLAFLSKLFYDYTTFRASAAFLSSAANISIVMSAYAANDVSARMSTAIKWVFVFIWFSSLFVVCKRLLRPCGFEQFHNVCCPAVCRNHQCGHAVIVLCLYVRARRKQKPCRVRGGFAQARFIDSSYKLAPIPLLFLNTSAQHYSFILRYRNFTVT